MLNQNLICIIHIEIGILQYLSLFCFDCFHGHDQPSQELRESRMSMIDTHLMPHGCSYIIFINFSFVTICYFVEILVLFTVKMFWGLVVVKTFLCFLFLVKYISFLVICHKLPDNTSIVRNNFILTCFSGYFVFSNASL